MKINYPPLKLPRSRQEGLFPNNNNQRYNNQSNKENNDSEENDDYFDSEDYYLEDNEINKSLNKTRTIRFKRGNTIINPMACNLIGRINQSNTPKNNIVSRSLTIKDVTKIYGRAKTSFKK